MEIMLLIQPTMSRGSIFLGVDTADRSWSWGVDIIPGTDKQTPFAKPFGLT